MNEFLPSNVNTTSNMNELTTSNNETASNLVVFFVASASKILLCLNYI